LIGFDGNAYSILGRCKEAARKAKWPTEKWEEFRVKAMGGDYDNLLRVATDYFEVD
jgi:hypothetical protein